MIDNAKRPAAASTRRTGPDRVTTTLAARRIFLKPRAQRQGLRPLSLDEMIDRFGRRCRRPIIGTVRMEGGDQVINQAAILDDLPRRLVRSVRCVHGMSSRALVD